MKDKREIIGLEKAQAFWGLTENGESLVSPHYRPGFSPPALFLSRDDAIAWAMDEEKPVRVYILVEDD